MRYPLLKDEAQPVQAKHSVGNSADLDSKLAALRSHVESLEASGDKTMVTPDVGVELFRLGRLTEKVPQFQLLANVEQLHQ